MGLSQGTIQIQKQTMQQTQRLSPQQIQYVRLLELPVSELAQSVKSEVMDNPALDEGLSSKNSDDKSSDDEMFEGQEGGEQQEEEYEAPESFNDYQSDDDDNGNDGYSGYDSKQEIVIGSTKSFVDDLMEQVADYDLTSEQKVIIEYLINSLDNHGFLTSSVTDIMDDMEIYHNIPASQDDVEYVLGVLQQFDPAGIGAHDVRESLLLQINRKLADSNQLPFERIELLQKAYELIDKYFDLFTANRLQELQQALDVTTVRLEDIIKLVRGLNVYPGLALCESSSDSAQTAIPDFIVETDSEGNVDFSLNGGDVPSLHVSEEYLMLLKQMQTSRTKMSRRDQDSFTFYNSKVESARMFIKSILQRQTTMIATMKAIISLQHDFFISQDTDDLKKMILDDVAKIAGVDLSTVSRVCKGKYALVNGTIYPMSVFFRKERNGLPADRIKRALKEIVDGEDKHSPYNDDELVNLLQQKGYQVSRRTVNKYRSEMGIISSKQRKWK